VVNDVMQSDMLARLAEGVRTAVFYEDVPSGYLTRGIVHLERHERDDRVWWWVHGWRRSDDGSMGHFSETKESLRDAMLLAEEATRRTMPSLEEG
jgi:hypothetical protein